MSTKLIWQGVTLCYKILDKIKGTRKHSWNPDKMEFYMTGDKNGKLGWFCELIAFLVGGVIPILITYMRLVWPSTGVNLGPIKVIHAIALSVVFSVQFESVGCFLKVVGNSTELVQSLNALIKMEQLLESPQKNELDKDMETKGKDSLVATLYGLLIAVLCPTTLLFPFVIPGCLMYLDLDPLYHLLPPIWESHWSMLSLRLILQMIMYYEMALMMSIAWTTVLLQARIGPGCLKLLTNLRRVVRIPGSCITQASNPKKADIEEEEGSGTSTWIRVQNAVVDQNDMSTTIDDIPVTRFKSICSADETHIQIYKMIQVAYVTLNEFESDAMAFLKLATFFICVTLNYVLVKLYDELPSLLYMAAGTLGAIASALAMVSMYSTANVMEYSTNLLQTWKSTARGKLQRKRIRALGPIAVYTGGYYPIRRTTGLTFQNTLIQSTINLVLSV